MEYTTIGIDVSKSKLDVFIFPQEEYLSVSNNLTGFAGLAKRISELSNVRVLLESTGCYHQNILDYLTGLGCSAYVINPKLVRDYAKSCGRLAKTDKLDAKMIAMYGITHELRASGNLGAVLKRFRILEERRRQLADTISVEKTRLEKPRFLSEQSIEKNISGTISFLEVQLAAIGKELEAIIAADGALLGLHDKLRSVSGVGKSTTYALIACMPELGRINKREAAALVGVAPMNCDSGVMRGQRHIKGGRFQVRHALYMACLSGIRCNPVIGQYYHRLREESKKPFKVAIVACMRKLLIHLNGICRENAVELSNKHA